MVKFLFPEVGSRIDAVSLYPVPAMLKFLSIQPDECNRLHRGAPGYCDHCGGWLSHPHHLFNGDGITNHRNGHNIPALHGAGGYIHPAEWTGI